MTQFIRPGRPFGVTLAIALSTLVFSIIPLLEVGFLVVVNQSIYQDETGVIVGTDLLQSASVPIFVQTFVALAFLLVAILAWQGGRPHIRLVFIGITIALAAILTIFQILPAIAMQPNLEQGVDSMAEILRQWRFVQLIVIVLIALYVVWYMNRWAACAFYRGYYTQSDIAHLREIGVDIASIHADPPPTDSSID